MRRRMAERLTAITSVVPPQLILAVSLALLPAAALAVEPDVFGASPEGRAVLAGDELVRVSGHGQPVEIEIWVNRGEGATYREGEEVGIRFRASRDCYVVIYDIDTEGFLTLLYPDDPYDDGFVLGGRVYRLPGSRGAYDLLAEGPQGVEYVAAVASLVPLAARLPWYLGESYEAYGYRGHYDIQATVSDVGAVRGDPYVAMRDIAYDILPESIREREYDTDYTYFNVGRKYNHPRYLCYDCHGRVGWLDPYHDSCSVFDIRVDLSWRFISRPTFYSVLPRFWYWRRPDCPPIYVGLPTFWSSLYPRRLYRAYYWDGLVRVGLRYERWRAVYPPPRYRGAPRYRAKGYAKGDPRGRHYGRRAPRRGSDPGRRSGGGAKPRYGGRGRADPPRDVKRPDRLAALNRVRRGSKGGMGARSGSVGKGAVGREAGESKLRIVKRRDRDRGEAKISKRRTAGARSKAKVTGRSDGRAGKSKAKVSKRKAVSRSKSKKESVRSGAGGGRKSGKAKRSDGGRRKSPKSRKGARSK